VAEENQELVEEELKKRRGPPVGNQNARVHGFYSSVLAPDELQSLEQAGEVDGIDSEIALLRVKLQSIVKHDPDNLELIAKAVVALTKLLMTKATIAKQDKGGFKQTVIEALKDLALPFGVGVGNALKK